MEKQFKAGDKVKANGNVVGLQTGKEYTFERYSGVKAPNGERRVVLVGTAYNVRPAESAVQLVGAEKAEAPQLPGKYSKVLAQVRTLLNAGATGIQIQSRDGSIRVTATLDKTI